MRRLTRSSPKCSASSVLRAAPMSMLSASGVAQGSSVIQSSQVLSIEYSPAASCMRSSRRNSLRTWASTSGGIFAAVIAASMRAISCALPPSSPSSFLIVLSCSSSR